ncbi:MAG: agmatinase [Steroidobacteraceae bacterium]
MDHREKLERYHRIAEECDAAFSDERMNRLRANTHNTGASFAGLRTFLGMPYQPSLAGIDIALIGVPTDLGVTNRSGARFGPTAIRQVSYNAGGPLHHASRIVPLDLCRIADCGDVPIEHIFGLEATIQEIRTFFDRVKDGNIIPISAGGDHSITFPILQALGRDEPVGLVHIDAHCDTCGALGGSRFHHGGPFRNAALAGVLDPERTIQIGIRGRAEPYWDFSYKSGMTVVHVEQCRESGIKRVIDMVLKVIGNIPTYLSIDVDGIDPAYTPGTGTPETGGLRPDEVQEIVRALRGCKLIGADVVEVAPPYDNEGQTTALVGATMMWEALCVIADSMHV